MAIGPGDKLEHFEILAAVGKGGMGEVFRARDTRLNREVAIKTSAERFSERFEREAQAIAALNHPNICTLFDVGPNYLVMEYIEGESPKGPLPIATVLDYARQMVDALDAAHSKGITHRDLKPGNLKVTPDGKLKVLDFGLAKVSSASTQNRESYRADESPTLTIGMTEAGMILGTAAYMAPEQAKGKPVDKRADIWAFGVVLYELATGKRLFKGEDVSDILASVLKDEPDLTSIPAQLRPLLQRCLEKDPKKRLRDIADAAVLLDDGSAPTEPAKSKTSWLGWTAAAVFALSTAALAWLWTRPVPPPVVTRFQIFAPPGSTLPLQTPAPSPDGRMLAYTIADAAGVRRLYIRRLDRTESTLLPGTEEAQHPFWSPDGKSLAFVVGRTMKRIDLEGGSPRALPVDVNGAWHGTLNEAGDILAALNNGGVWRLSARTAGTPTLLSRSGGHPAFLPDGKRFLFRTDPDMRLGSLDSTDSSIVLKGVSSAPLLAASPDGKTYLFFLEESDLAVQEFDPEAGTVRGKSLVIIPNIGRVASPPIKPTFGVSQTGVMAFQTQSGAANERVTWLDRAGKNLGLISAVSTAVLIRSSPDGAFLATLEGSDIWVTDLARGTKSRLTRDGKNSGVAWSPDSKRIVTRKNTDPPTSITAVNLDGSGEQELAQNLGVPTSWDAQHLVLQQNGQVFVTSADAKQPPQPVSLPTSANGTLSPDGFYIAYESNANGPNEVYLEPLPPLKGRIQVSASGGRYPRWRPDGKELFYRSADNNMMAVDVSLGVKASVGIPRKLFQIYNAAGRWDIHPDGKRFAIIPDSGAQTDNPITVVLNWFADLQE